jgi:hypothetical protein
MEEAGDRRADPAGSRYWGTGGACLMLA